jgi:phosphate-selective porin OprO/OprP
MSLKATSGVLRPALVLAALLAGTNAVRADDRDDIQSLRDQIRLLDQKLRVLERKSELKEEDAAAAAKTAPKITVNDKGVTLASADGANSIKLRGLVQLDSRTFFGDNGITNNSFVLRRARLITEGTFAKNFAFQLVPEFGGSTVSILDANLSLTLNKALTIKAGKFKVPVGYELLQSDSWTFFDERALPTNLVPNRDIGVQLGGELLDGTVTYAAGVFGGVSDGGSTANSDFDNEKDVAARIFATPFKNSADSPVQGLGIGLSGSLGREKTAAALTGGYRTPGQQTFFRYRATAVNDGQVWRVSPHLDYRNGPLGVIGEYVVSVVNARPTPTGAKAELENKSWQIVAGYVLTGEDSSYAGVVPKTNFDLAAGTWGAFELAARYENLKVDHAAFPLFADPAANANEASAIGVGLNWYLSKAVRTTVDYYQTTFKNNGIAPTSLLLRQDEKALITRFQVAF